jgi:hypothetical protein
MAKKFRKGETSMTDKELRRLSRTDLLELLVAQRRENEQLRCILDQTQAQLADRTIKIDNAGSIAEASLQLSGIFNAAQDSCQYYLDNIRLLSERQAQVCQQMEQETREKCERMEAEAQLRAQQCWDNCSAKIKQLVDSFEGLQQVMDLYSSLHKKNEKPVTESVQAGVYGRIY